MEAYTTINFTERSGNDDVAIQEPLFDTLIKKALAYVKKNTMNHKD